VPALQRLLGGWKRSRICLRHELRDLADDRHGRSDSRIFPAARLLLWGGPAPQPRLLNQFGLLRAAWFMEKAAADVAARKTGVVPSYLKPLEQFRMANPVVSRSLSEASQFGDPSLGRV
jgi:hypothetical protein